MSILSHNLKGGRYLTLGQHLSQIRAAAEAIRRRHSVAVRENCVEAWAWLEDAIRLHDVGKGSAQFQAYIRDPDRYLKHRRPSTKSHTPLSLAATLALARAERWDWRRAFAVGQLASGHHGELEPRGEIIQGLDNALPDLEGQVSGVNWGALGAEVGWGLGALAGVEAHRLVDEGSELLEELFDEAEQERCVRFRLLCQLAFSVLLEADKAFLAVDAEDLPRYLGRRREALPVEVVERFLAGKASTGLDGVRADARRELLAGMARVGEAGVQTLTMPTGTGKTLLAATWALRQREGRVNGEEPPLLIVVLPFLTIIDQTTKEYEAMFAEVGLEAGDLVGYHSLSDRTYAPDLEDRSNDFFLDTWQSSVVITTFDQFLLALLSPKGRHQMRFHHLVDAVVVLDEVQALPPRLWAPLRAVLFELTKLGTTRVLAMSATQPGFLRGAAELAENPEEFFRRMARYKLVLRLGEVMALSRFAEECVARATDDWAGKRVLVTLNTRRSARSVRDALDKVAPEVEFITADVTPADRLAAVGRIKEGRPCLVVSTQCIEAGVDIDMDLVVRDFGPLDSLVQVAGRCNRNGRPTRGVVEVVRLREDDGEKEFAGYIYDTVLRDVTLEVLAGRAAVAEEEIYPLTAEYFRRLAARKDTGDEVLNAWAGWEECESVKHLLRGKEPRKAAFVVIENDPGLRAELDCAVGIADRWERRRALRQLAARIARQTVSVYMRDGFDASAYGEPFPAGKGREDAWFWLLDPTRKLYSPRTGLDLKGAAAEKDGWGVLL